MLFWAYGVLIKSCAFGDLLGKYCFLFHRELFAYESVCEDMILLVYRLDVVS